jgi:glutamate formiminotransferase
VIQVWHPRNGGKTAIPFFPIAEINAANCHMSIGLGKEQYLSKLVSSMIFLEYNDSSFLTKEAITTFASLLKPGHGDLCITLRTGPPFSL